MIAARPDLEERGHVTKRNMRITSIVLLVLFFVVLTPSAGTQASFQFCRDIPPDFNCVGPGTVFPTNSPFVWVMISVAQPGPYEVKIEWIAPDSSTYATRTARTDQRGIFRWRFQLTIQSQRAETLPGEWTVRAFVDGRLVGSSKFTLLLVGEPKFWVPSFGVVGLITAVTAKSIESGRPVGETTEFKLGETVYSFVQLSIPPSRAGIRVPFVWKWTSPSGEVLEGTGQFGPTREGLTTVSAWRPLPSFEGRVQQPIGEWQVEFAVEGAVVAKFKFSFMQ
ncbi:MAG: hypothetical protein ACRDF5_04135 [bacterium]